MPSDNSEFSAWRDRLRRLARNLLGPVSRRADTSDILQEVSVQILGQGDDFREMGDGYLAVAARGHAAKLHRFHNRECRAIDREATLHDTADTGLTPDQILQKREALVRLAEAVERLPEDDQRLIYQRIHCGLTFAKIAEDSHQTERSVWLAFNRAIRQLRGLLGNESPE